jgi:Helix-turn-helix of DDE superfamily endonuclease
MSAPTHARLPRRRGHARHRAAGAGPHRLALCDRVLVTLVVLRLQLPHQALATLFGVDRVTITRAVGRSARCWPPAGLSFGETYLAVAGLVSDRAAPR